MGGLRPPTRRGAAFGRPPSGFLFGGFGEGFWKVLGWFLEGFGNLEGLGDGFLIVFGGFGEFGGFGGYLFDGFWRVFGGFWERVAGRVF